MEADLLHQVLARVQQDYGFKPPRGEYLRGGRCPACGRKELYANASRPWVLRCGRLKNCGQEFPVKELYPDLFDDWSKRFQRSDAKPNAAADAYLQFNRGFDIRAMAGWYTQETYYDRSIGQGTATVRFPLDKGGYWERLIDRPGRFGKQKARFAPGQSWRGVWWVAPTLKNRLASHECREIWIVEGIFDAIALMQHGIDAVAALSCNAFPGESLEALAKVRAGHLPTLVWALDNDVAGQGFLDGHVRQAKKLGFTSRAALIPQPAGRKLDWNDLHLRALAIADPAEGAKRWQRDIEEARYHGALALADSPKAKAMLMYRHTRRTAFDLEFGHRMYWFQINAAAFEKKKAEYLGQHDLDELDDEAEAKLEAACSSVTEIAPCRFQALYFQRNPVTDESWYFFRVDFPHDGPSVKNTFTGKQTTSAADFKARLRSIAAGAGFSGNQHQFDTIMDRQLFNLRQVETVDFVGYSREHGAWVFNDFAVRDGAVIEANAEEFFEFGKLRLKTTQKSIALAVNRDPEAFRTDWVQWLWTAFGTHGMVALAFFFGSLFAEQIRAAHKSFPFLEATGEAGAGKTTLLTFLWKLLGRSDYEGFDPNKSSLPGRSRAMGQISNMPVVLLESDRSTPDKSHAKSFDWDELKDFYNGGTLRTRGVKNGGNETYEPPFRGTIIISQNAAVDASEAILSRIVKLHFVRPTVTTESRIAADNLNHVGVEEVSHFMLKAIRAEARILETYQARFRHYEEQLRRHPELRMERIAKNHAQMLALLDCLRFVVDIPASWLEATRQALVGMAVQRQWALNADHPLVHEFWEVFEYLEAVADGPVVNHARDPELIAINLNHFQKKAMEHNQRIADLNTLRALLPNSRRHRLVRINHPVSSALFSRPDPHDDFSDQRVPRTVKCWVFERRT